MIARREPPLLIIPGRIPGHRSNVQAYFQKAQSYKSKKAFLAFLGRHHKPYKQTISAWLYRILVPQITYKKIMNDWLKHAYRCVDQQRGNTRFYGWVHIRWYYYPPDQRSINVPDVSSRLADIIEDHRATRNIGGKLRHVVVSRGYIPIYRRIVHFDGSRIMLPCKDYPRLEVWIWPYAAGPGEYRGT